MSNTDNKAAIVLIDAQELRRASFSSLLTDWAASKGRALCAASLCKELQDDPQKRACDMVIFSHGRERVDAHDAQSHLRLLRTQAPDARLVIISDLDDAVTVSAALSAGVHGFIPTSMDPELTLEALTFILHGGTFFPPTAVVPGADTPTDRTLRPPGGGDPQGHPITLGDRQTDSSAPDREAVGEGNLTSRQQEVMALLCKGQPNKVIARGLGMTEATVKVHVRQIMLKLGVTNRTQVAIRVMQDSLNGMRSPYEKPNNAQAVSKRPPCALARAELAD